MDDDRIASGNLLLTKLNLESHSALESIEGRSKCSKCKASRKFYCYTCYILVDELKGRIPQVKLPLKIDIIKHPKEIDGKSTAIHAGLISPDDVTIYTFPCIPDFEPNEKVVIVYPSKNAMKIDELFKKTKKENVIEVQKKDIPFTRVVFIDSTWNQSNQIFKDERLKGLPCVMINSRETCFWRTQKDKPNTYLATIEAIYYFLVDFYTLAESTPYDGCFDNLLYFYSFMYKVVAKSNEEKKQEGMENIRKRKREEWEEKIKNKKVIGDDGCKDDEKEKSNSSEINHRIKSSCTVNSSREECS